MDTMTAPEVSGAIPSSLINSELMSRVNEALDSQKWQTALTLLEQIIAADPRQTSPCMTAGLVALKLEDPVRAAGYFRQVLTAAPDHAEASYNLAILELTQGHTQDALQIFRRLHHSDPANATLSNDLAVVWADLDRPARALVSYRQAMRLDPENSHARNNAMQHCLQHGYFPQALRLLGSQEEAVDLSNRSSAEVHRWKEIIEESYREWEEQDSAKTEPGSQVEQIKVNQTKPRLAFFATHRTFIDPLIKSLSENYQVRLFDGDSLDQMKELMAWADVAWFEWCDQLLIQATRLPKTCRIICRLHSYEAFTDMPSQVDWSRVDKLVFVNQSVLDLFKQQVKDVVPICIIHNGVDLDRFALPEEKITTKRIASVGYINYKKNPQLLLYAFKKIHEYDPEYTLHIAGTHQDSRIELYFRKFMEGKKLPIYFDGWVEDMPTWYEDKGYVISTSLFESFHYSIAEGMASGLLPLVHSWYGSSFLYPEQFLYDDPDDCLKLLQRLEREDHEKLRLKNHAYILKRYNHLDKVDEIDATIRTVLAPGDNTASTIATSGSNQKPESGKL